MTLALVPAVLAGPAQAAPPNTKWIGVGPTGVVVSDGTTSAPQFSYALTRPPTGDHSPQTWSFTTTADADGNVELPFQYQGFHAFFRTTVQLSAIVTHNGVTTSTILVDDGPVDCCAPPSGGFAYNRKTTLSVQAGDTYGFTFGGSNFDSDNRLLGTLTVQFSGFVDPALVAQNTSWTTAAPLTTAGADGTLTQAGEARWYKFPVVPSSQVQVTLGNLAQNYDLTLYDDIGAAFTTLTTTTDLNTLGAEQSGNAYSPSIYSPSIYSPSIYSPSIYSPSIYSPSIY
ncbi:MAG: large repetitive protein, partial [Pseudonocardiales bacterium]|nr:large repetitive protein [Pseudonocardiales bacterium]